ncbi:MAG: RidA family protein [Clostridiales bacterium]|nr:RidA family protein [Clostridiales bacterium]
MTIPERIARHIGPLPTPPKPIAMFVPVTQSGNILHISGQGPNIENGVQYRGKLGAECDIQTGYNAARLCGVNLLAHLKAYLDDLDRVEKLLKATVYVASADDFYDQPLVANGFSELMVQIFEEKGYHARCAVGMASLPGNIPVEIDLVVQVRA